MKKINSMLLMAIALILLCAVLTSGCVSNTGAEDGDTVYVYYYGTLDDGTKFDDNHDKAPLEVVLGEHRVVPGFENALYGMKIGETKTVRIAPEDAYGYPNPDYIIPFDREEFESIVGTVQVGDTIYSISGSGVVVEITDENVVIDFNHPLAGYDLTFEIKVADLVKGK